MSGGSFNYLYLMEVDQVIEKDHWIKSMAERLDELGEGRAAALTYALVNQIEFFKRQVTQDIDRLREAWHATEWLTSGDIGGDTYDKRMNEWIEQMLW
jgi:hypothetical protein